MINENYQYAKPGNRFQLKETVQGSRCWENVAGSGNYIELGGDHRANSCKVEKIHRKQNRNTLTEYVKQWQRVHEEQQRMIPQLHQNDTSNS